MTEAVRRPSICKIVCFDEGSATDYIQIVNGGAATKTTEHASEKEGSAQAKVEAKASIKTRIIEILTGLDVAVDASGAAGMSFSTGAVAKSIISNTVLTDFLEEVMVHKDIRLFEGFAIEAIDNSLSSYALMTPYLAMLRDGNIPAGDFNLALDKLDSTIKDAKGYYEFIGHKGAESIVFRFNRQSFKNNYKATDLFRMNLAIYAVKVGTCTLDDLDVSRELNMPRITVTTNPDYESLPKSSDKGEEAKEYDVYDVFLAGVKAHG